MNVAADPAKERRRQRMGLLAQASASEFSVARAALGSAPEVIDLRGPETGLVMLTGRIGGDGARFNLGEATISRSTVRLASGQVGFGQLLGSDRNRARDAAIFDALADTEEGLPVVEELCATVQARLADERLRQEAETASTRVDFFTLVRGED